MKKTNLHTFFLLLALSLNAATPTSNAPFLKPAEAIAKMEVPDQFEVTAFVAEPDIGEAIAFCFDHKGRLWTLENHDYQTRRSHTTHHKNRIQIYSTSSYSVDRAGGMMRCA